MHGLVDQVALAAALGITPATLRTRRMREARLRATLTTDEIRRREAAGALIEKPAGELNGGPVWRLAQAQAMQRRVTARRPGRPRASN